jgi:hypothetical protein
VVSSLASQHLPRCLLASTDFVADCVLTAG